MLSGTLKLAGILAACALLGACSNGPSMYAVKDGATEAEATADAIACGAYDRWLDTGVQLRVSPGKFEKCMQDKGYEIIKA